MFDKTILKFVENKHAMVRITALTALFAILRAAATVGQALGLSCAVVSFWAGGSLGGVDSTDMTISASGVLGTATSSAATSSAATSETLLGWIALFAVCFVARQILLTAEESITDAFAANIADAARTQLLEDIFQAGPSITKAQGRAALVANATEDIANIETYARIVFRRSADVVVIPLALLIVMFAIDWVSGLIALVCYPFIMLFMRLIGSTAKEKANARHAEFEQMSNGFADVSAGVDTLKAYRAGAAYSSRIYEMSERFREITMKTLKVSMLSSTVLDLFATLGLAAVAIMLGFRMVDGANVAGWATWGDWADGVVGTGMVDGALAFLPALVVLMLVPEFFTPIREFGTGYHATLDGKTALANIAQVHEVVTESHWQDSRISLPDFSFSTKPHIVGIFGESGAGKSTLLDVLAGFTDPVARASSDSENGKTKGVGGETSGGKIIVDGVECDTLRTPKWQRRVAYIPQNPCIFHASLRENLAFYNPLATDAEIEDALDALGMLNFVRSLDFGLDTKIGSGGLTLSDGQEQRIALARALLDPARTVWVLDEPTAHLDIETELELKNRMLPLMQGKLVFLATHRQHWRSACDVIFDFDAADRACGACGIDVADGACGSVTAVTAVTADATSVTDATVTTDATSVTGLTDAHRAEGDTK